MREGGGGTGREGGGGGGEGGTGSHNISCIGSDHEICGDSREGGGGVVLACTISVI